MDHLVPARRPGDELLFGVAGNLLNRAVKEDRREIQPAPERNAREVLDEAPVTFFALLKFVFQPSETDVLLFKALYFPRQIFHRRIFYHGSSPCLQDSPSWVRIIIVEPSSVIPGTPGGYPGKVKALGSNLHVWHRDKNLLFADLTMAKMALCVNSRVNTGYCVV